MDMHGKFLVHIDARSDIIVLIKPYTRTDVVNLIQNLYTTYLL